MSKLVDMPQWRVPVTNNRYLLLLSSLRRFQALYFFLDIWCNIDSFMKRFSLWLVLIIDPTNLWTKTAILKT